MMLFWEHEPVYSNAIVSFAILFYLSTFFSCSLYDKVFLEEKTDHLLPYSCTHRSLNLGIREKEICRSEVRTANSE